MPGNGTIKNADIEKYVDLVLEGGGVKGIALVGALTTLEEQGFLPQNLAGTSAGAIVATLYAAGYKASELRDNIGSLNVPFALRMSMSIPIFSEPVEFRNPQTGREHLIVDGGILSNYPVWLFDVQGTPDWPTFGLRLVEPSPATPIGDRLPEPHHAR